MHEIICNSAVQQHCSSSPGKRTPCSHRGQILPLLYYNIFFHCQKPCFMIKLHLVLLQWIVQYFTSFLSFLKHYFWEIGKQLKRILQWKAVREAYVSIRKVYLKNENTCPFVQLQLPTEQISEGRSRCHCRAPRKKMGHLKQTLFRSADLDTQGR